jgi:pimeloyl-ACP methyl ester carboxylesterase
MGTPYIEKLSTELERNNWSLCQLHMRSSYLGYGTGSLARDFEDITSCLNYLVQLGKQRIILMGHSTGCQNSVFYVLNRAATSAPRVHGVVVGASLFRFLILSYKHLSAIESSFDMNSVNLVTMNTWVLQDGWLTQEHQMILSPRAIGNTLVERRVPHTAFIR